MPFMYASKSDKTYQSKSRNGCSTKSGTTLFPLVHHY